MSIDVLHLHPPPQQAILIVEDDVAVANSLRRIVENAGYKVSGVAHTTPEALESKRQHRPDLVLLDIFLQSSQAGIDLARHLNEELIPFVYVSDNVEANILEEANATQPYGLLLKPFRKKDVLATLQIALYRHAHSAEARLREEQALQLSLMEAFTAPGDWDERLLKVARIFQPVIPFDYLVIGLTDEYDSAAIRSTSFVRIGQDEYQTVKPEAFVRMTGLTPEQFKLIRAQTPKYVMAAYNGEEFEADCRRNPLRQLIAKTFDMHANLLLPLQTSHYGFFYLSFFSRQPDTYRPHHLQLIQHLQASLTPAVDRLLAFDKIEQLSEQLRQENTYLLEEVKSAADFEQIIGSSARLREVFKSIGQVAPTDYTVLVLGETGTGKELIARAVHNRSSRKGKALIKVNCAALPPQLIESELFGHEKGSFTGATDQRIGKFELAHGGTIFLDEIGELPLELQPKLLRVLQEQEIERIGGKGPRTCNVRIIAASNRNLQLEVAAGRFRADLFYRLNVFPVTLPALRERPEDLLPLTAHFMQKIAKNLGKHLTGISESSLLQMQAYHWPGNVRELEHLLERAAIMATSPVISLTETLVAGPFMAPLAAPPAGAAMPFEQAERENMLSALRQANYRIRGKGGAAELLAIKPTTLEAKMVRLGIRRNR